MAGTSYIGRYPRSWSPKRVRCLFLDTTADWEVVDVDGCHARNGQRKWAAYNGTAFVTPRRCHFLDVYQVVSRKRALVRGGESSVAIVDNFRDKNL